MSTWAADELDAVGSAEELEVASLRRDGSLGKRVTVWVVRHGDELYVRSVNGPAAAWYRATIAEHAGRIWAGGIERDVEFEDADHDLNSTLDAEYARKYARYAQSIIDHINSDGARSTTYRLVSRAAHGGAA